MEPTSMADKVSTSVGYATSGGNILFGLWTANDFSLVVGAVCAIAMVLVNAYYKQKHYELTRESLERGLKPVADNEE